MARLSMKSQILPESVPWSSSAARFQHRRAWNPLVDTENETKTFKFPAKKLQASQNFKCA